MSQDGNNALANYAQLAGVLAQLASNALEARAKGRELAQAAGASPAELDRLDAEADARFQLPLVDPLAKPAT